MIWFGILIGFGIALLYVPQTLIDLHRRAEKAEAAAVTMKQALVTLVEEIRCETDALRVKIKAYGLEAPSLDVMDTQLDILEEAWNREL